MIPGGVADLSFPTSKTRRGRVEEEGALAPTITTTGGLYKVDYDKEELIKKLKIRKLVPEETFNHYVPVINTETRVINPFHDPSVTIGKNYYDYKADEENQKKAIIEHDSTYIQEIDKDVC